MSHTMTKLIAACIAATSVAVSCGDGAEDGTQAPASSSTSQPTPSTASHPGATLNAALLSAQDLPAEWLLKETDGSAGTTDICGTPFPPPQPLEEASIKFGHSRDGSVLSQYLARYPEADAQAALSQLGEAVEACDEWTGRNSEGETISWRMSTLEVGELGDDRVGIKLSTELEDPFGTGEVGPFTYRLHAVIMRRGGTINWMSYNAFAEEEVPADIIAGFARQADEKLVRAVE